MKSIAFLLGLILYFGIAPLQAQTCMDFTGTTNQYLQDISMNNTLYPIGSVVFQTGDIKIRKAGTPAQFINAHGDTMCYVGKIDLDVTSAPYAQRMLTFTSISLQGIIVDGDTVFQNFVPIGLYNGNGFTVTYLNNVFTITGAFNVVHLFGSTNCLNTICLNQGPAINQTCLNFGTSVTAQYCNDISQNHTLYPVGSVLFQSPPIRIIKADTTTTFLNARNDTIWYIGRLLIDVSTASYSSRRLVFNSVIVSGSIVDGDTAFQTMPPPPAASGPNYQFSFSNPVFEYTGTFDSVLLYGSTNIVSGICLEPDTPSTQSCMDFSGTTQQYIQDVSTNNTLYPVGSVVFQTGDIRIRKAGIPFQVISASSDTLCYIGKVEIDVAQAPYPGRLLTFYSIITQGMVVDGDTIFQASNPAPFYAGNGFTVAYANNIFTITGTFDTVHIFGSTNCLNSICLQSVPTAIDLDAGNGFAGWSAFPNPTTGQITLKHETHSGPADVRVYSLQGALLLHQVLEAGMRTLSLQGLPAGLYLLSIQTQDNPVSVIRVVVQE